MIRGTTPTHTFTLPFDVGNVKEARVIYAQNGQEIFTKTTEECTLAGNTLSTRLTQEETFLLDSALSVQIQLRILTQLGEVLTSDIENVLVGQCLDDEVLT